METQNRNAHKEFLDVKQDLINLFAKEISTVLIEMGDDVKGISWFSSIADEYRSLELDQAA